VSALAYVTDYHVIPSRFTPGFELSLSRRSFPSLYAALALGLLMPHYRRFFFLRAMRMLSTRLG
jgi:hypothetical protein